MAKRKRKRNEILEGMTPALSMGFGSVGASVLGGAIQSKLPAGAVNPLTKTGSVMGSFVGPVAVIGAGGIVLKKLKKIKMKGGRRR